MGRALGPGRLIHPSGEQPAPPAKVRGSQGETFIMPRVHVQSIEPAIMESMAWRAAYIVLAAQVGREKANALLQPLAVEEQAEAQKLAAASAAKEAREKIAGDLAAPPEAEPQKEAAATA